jgi:hypothetical protein
MAAQPRKRLTREQRATELGKFATHLQKLLDERDLSVTAFAEAIETDLPTVRRWLRAETMPGSLALLKRIGKALHSKEHPFPEWRFILPDNV